MTMAIYHFSGQVVKRSSGKSAVSAAAYRAGEKLEDERVGETYNYTRRADRIYAEILAPDDAPDWVFDRGKLWNKVEKSERRSDAQLAREFNVALPIELDFDQQLELARSFCLEEFVDRGMVADLALHFHDPDNPHFHVMLTMRELDGDDFSKRKNREWNEHELMVEWREAWSEKANQFLIPMGIDPIDHRSNKDRGIEMLPTIHEGTSVREMEDRGIETDRRTINLEVEEYNRYVMEQLEIEQALSAAIEEREPRVQMVLEDIELQKNEIVLRDRIQYLRELADEREKVFAQRLLAAKSLDQMMRMLIKRIFSRDEIERQKEEIQRMDQRLHQLDRSLENLKNLEHELSDLLGRRMAIRDVLETEEARDSLANMFAEMELGRYQDMGTIFRDR